MVVSRPIGCADGNHASGCQVVALRMKLSGISAHPSPTEKKEDSRLFPIASVTLWIKNIQLQGALRRLLVEHLGIRLGRCLCRFE